MALTKITNDGVDFSGTTDINIDSGTLVVDASNNNVGIGTTSPHSSIALDVVGQIRSSAAINAGDGASNSASIRFWNANTGLYHPGSDALGFVVSASEKARIDSSGRLLVGTSSVINSTPLLQTANTSGGRLALGRNENAPTVGNTIGSVETYGNAGGTYDLVGALYVDCDASHTSSSKPTRLTFHTTASSATSPTERMRIDSSGRVGIGTTSPQRELHVQGSTNGTIRLQAANNATSQLLFSDSDAEIRGRVGYFHTDDALDFYSAGQEGMRLDSSGRLLVGTTTARTNLDYFGTAITPRIQLEGTSTNGSTLSLTANSASDGVAPQLRLSKSSNASAGGNGAVVNNEALGTVVFSGNDGTNFKTAAEILSSCDGTPSTKVPGRLQFYTGTDSADPSERMRINNAGRVMIGTSTPGHPNCDELTVAGSGHSGITIRSGSTSVGGIFFSDATTGSGEYDGYIEYNQNTRSLSFGVAAADAIRINEGGVVLVGSSSTWDSSGSGQSFYIHNTTDRNVLKLSNNDGGSAPYGLIGFYRNKGSVIGRITTDGSTITYGTSSDYRLKENVVDLDGAITRVKQLAPKRFNWIADETDSPVDGFLAHEAQVVVPEAVVGEKDEVDDEGDPVYQNIDQSKLVPLLTAALQEAIGEIESLKARVSTLEAN